MFSKRLADLTAADINDIIDRGVQEDVTIELKQALSTRDGSPDVWMKDQSGIGGEAKRDLSKELVAFANTDGGTLILGIVEDADKRASSIKAIPACRKLADRLAQSIASATDPKLVNIEYAGVPTEVDGSGVCVFRVPQSHRAPHRDTFNRECYTRVGDRSEPMTMRQVQDLVLQRSRGLEDVRRALDARSAGLFIRSQPVESTLPDGTTCLLRSCAIRATAVPLEDVSVDQIHRSRQFMFNLPQLDSDGTDGPQETIAFQESRNWEPMLRGLRYRYADSQENFVSEDIITANGMIECALYMREDSPTHRRPVISGVHVWFLFRTFVYLLVTVEAFRVRYGRPDMAFALDFEWKFDHEARILMQKAKGAGWQKALKPIEPTNRVSSYEMPPRDGLPTLLARLSDDVSASCGMNVPSLITIDFDRAIESVLQR